MGFITQMALGSGNRELLALYEQFDPLAAPQEVSANSGKPGAFDTLNAAYATTRRAQGCWSVLNAADITGRLSRSLWLARHQLAISQDTLAARLRERGLHVRRNEIRRWEHGLVRISERNLLVIVAVLGHDLSWWYADHDAELAELDVNHRAIA